MVWTKHRTHYPKGGNFLPNKVHVIVWPFQAKAVRSLVMIRLWHKLFLAFKSFEEIVWTTLLLLLTYFFRRVLFSYYANVIITTNKKFFKILVESFIWCQLYTYILAAASLAARGERFSSGKKLKTNPQDIYKASLKSTINSNQYLPRS